MTKHVLVPIADGTEEIEAVCIIDVLRRAGAEVTVASVTAQQVTASRGVRLVADCLIDACVDHEYDLVALPGGMPGAANLRDSAALKRLLEHHNRRQALLGAICAAPAVVLTPHGLLVGRRATSHPHFVARLENAGSADDRVVVDGNCVTSRAPGTAIEFALKLVEMLFGTEKAREVAAPMLVA